MDVSVAPAVIYFAVSVMGFFYTWKSVVVKKAKSDKDIISAPFEKNKILAVLHSILLFVLSAASFCYALIWINLLQP